MLTQPGSNSYLCAVSVSYIAHKLVRDSGQMFSVHLDTPLVFCSLHSVVLVYYAPAYGIEGH